MRMEELSDGRYVKSTDQVERYLLGLIEKYCQSSDVASPSSREYIIKKAVERMKEEISFDNMGVFSITLQDGEKRTGAVTITIEDLGGEPAISPKLSAFNVAFGTEQNTACEGNDPRLSDARKPLAHEHEISDVVGLEGQLKTLEGLLNRTNQFEHTHSNKDVLDMLTYNGEKTSIDLTVLDTLEDKINKIVEDIRQDITDHKKEIDNKVSEVNDKITEVKNKIEELKDYILKTNEEYLSKSKTYTDNSIQTATDKINSKIETLVTKDMLSGILSVANKSYTLVGKQSFTVASIDGDNVKTINQDLLDIITNNGTTIDDCLFEFNLKYYNENGNTIIYSLPYIVFSDDSICGMIRAEVLADGNIIFNIDVDTDSLPYDVMAGSIEVSIYSTSIVAI